EEGPELFEAERGQLDRACASGEERDRAGHVSGGQGPGGVADDPHSEHPVVDGEPAEHLVLDEEEPVQRLLEATGDAARLAKEGVAAVEIVEGQAPEVTALVVVAQ